VGLFAHDAQRRASPSAPADPAQPEPRAGEAHEPP
jgi:hypothetical protein